MKLDPKAILKEDRNVPIRYKENVQVSREYVRSNQIQELAVQKYQTNGKGITFNDLLSSGISKTTLQAQRKLKNCLKKEVLFTIQDHKPQQYYPTSIRAHILERKNVPIEPTGIQYNHYNAYQYQYNNNTSTTTIPASDSFIAHILPLLPATPSYIHNMHFKLRVTPECYIQLNLPQYNTRNKGKHHYENIGSVHVDYTFYPNGTIDVTSKCSSIPFKLENETDLARVIAFLGQLRDRLILLLADKKERLVPDITEWHLTELDINKDVEVNPSLHISVPNIQVKRFNHLFRIYIKSMGEHTVCRVEESMHPPSEKSAIEAINDIFNPVETRRW